MEQYNYVNEEAKLKTKLRKMKIISTSLLVFMTLVFILFKRLEDRGIFYSSVAAFAEASMVGALADWFAVVALFKYPLGLKIIPHTAIIANNKPRIARALSNFVVANFFTPEIIRTKLDKVSFSGWAIKYVQENKEAIIRGIAVKLPAILDKYMDDARIEGLLRDTIQKKLNQVELYPLLADALQPAVEAGYHKPVVKKFLNAVYNYVSENKEKTMVVIGGINKALTMPFIGDLVYKKILEFFERQVEEIETNEDAEVNKLLLEMMPKLLDDMKSSPELIEKGEILKSKILNSAVYEEMVRNLANIIIEFKNSLTQNEEMLNRKIADILEYITEEVSKNIELQKNLDNTISESLEKTVAVYGSKVGSLIYDTMDGWETKDMVQKLEVQVGADLQYIRINGTVIGGLAGLAIHFLSMLL